MEDAPTIQCTCQQTRFDIESPNYREAGTLRKFGVIYMLTDNSPG